MVVFTGISMLISTLVSLFVAVRLWRLARRTRAQPEWLLAIAFAGLTGVGMPAAGISRAPGLVMTTDGALLYALASIGMVTGTAALARFPYVVFRRGQFWAAGLAMIILSAGLAAGVGSTVVVATAHSKEAIVTGMQPWALLLISAISLSFLWNAIESTLYYRKMKRRLALGLAQPETTHRFLLWAIASSVTVLLTGTILCVRAMGVNILTTLPLAFLSIGCLITSGCWGLAFFMPDAYRTRFVGEVNDDPQAASAARA